MYKIDDWAGAMGRHFARVMEAYIACLHAHRPASIVFAEDLKPDTLKQYEAVLVVGQTVEMEPLLATALEGRQASRRGDFRRRDLPRRSWSRIFLPLGVSFNHTEKDPSLAADDHAYWRTAAYAKAAAPLWPRRLARVRAGRGGGEPGGLYHPAAGRGGPLSLRGQQHHVRRTGARTPVARDAGLRQPGAAIGAAEARRGRGPGRLRCFRGKAGPAGRWQVARPTAAICRPAFLPFCRRPMARVQVEGPKGVTRGETIQWKVQVQDSAGKAIAAAVPVRVRLLAADGSLLDQQYASAASQGTGGEFILPLNAPGGPVALEAVELLSGKAARLQVAVADVNSPLPFAGEGQGVSCWYGS